MAAFSEILEEIKSLEMMTGGQMNAYSMPNAG